MVKHGRNKKRRAGRIGRTKLKNRNYAKFKPTIMQNEMCKKNWDPTKSPAVNLQKIGLTSQVNAGVKSRGNTNTTSKDHNKVKAPSAIELFDIPTDRPKRVKPLTKDFQKYISKCLAKHGDNFVSMARDIKLNNMQHTPNVLEKMAKKFLAISQEEREFDIPEKVRHMI